LTAEKSLPGREPISRLSTPRGLLARFLATGCFVGHLPLAPGTWGSILALVLGYLFLPGSWLLQLSVILVIFFLGVWTSSAAEKSYGHDGRPIVIDEVLGMLVVLFILPKEVGFYLAAFILFRFFDIVKPPPSRQMESLPAGWGVMMDDLLAGIYGFLVMRLLVLLA
jgi:phosphatidylglycerophosphatase A